MSNVSRDYHDYIFKGDKLIGEFDQMYRNSSEIPWHQDEEAASWICDMSLKVIEPFAPYSSVLDIGCGLGYFTKRLRTVSQNITGFDVSQTAVIKARELFPDIRFEVADITNANWRLKSFDLVVIKDLFWYVFPSMSTVVANIKNSMGPRAKLFVFQSFPRLSKEFIGKSIIPNPQSLAAHFSGFAKVLTTCDIQRHDYYEEGPMCMWLWEKKE